MFGVRRETKVKPAVQVAAPDAGQEALRFLATQGLPQTPENYALAWQAKVECRGLVAMAVDAILMDGRAILPVDVARIMSVPSKEHDSEKDAVRHQTIRLAELAAGAAASSSTFNRALIHGLAELASDEVSLHRIVEAMVSRTETVEAELRSASREIQALREQVESVRDDAHRDALTGLLNRRGVMHELDSRRTDHRGVIAICDVDHFKSINDRFGHNVGDRVLKGVASSLVDGCGLHQVARWGGEEFVIVMEGVEMAGAARLLECARSGLSSRSFRVRETDEPIGRVTISVGAASMHRRGVAEAMEIADRRLYEAKRGGRDRLVAGGLEA